MAGFSGISLTEAARELRKEETQKLRRIALRALRGVVLRSPVGNATLWANPDGAPPGYVGGRFRANWTVGIRVPDRSTKDSTGNVAVREGQQSIAAAQLGTDIYISNSLPYAVRLENGWSSQAPLGMVTLTLLEVSRTP